MQPYKNSVDINSFYFSVKVFDEDSKPIILNESGYISPKPIITNSNKITLTFTSDGNNGLTRFDSYGRWEARFILIT